MKNLTVLLLLLLSATFVFSQGKDNSLKGVPFKERIVTGGGFGLGFSNSQDQISVSPIIGYALTKKLIAGTGVSYQYINYKGLSTGNVSVSNVGINPFARFTVYQNFFAQAEFEHLSYQGIYISNNAVEKVRLSYQSVLAGGGLLQPMGNKASFFIMALYNFSYRNARPGEFLPYNSPWVIRAGINLGGFIF